jgi:HAE1 family hydrophobic/amphiphilic exporter-1/multidrug efflux pump
MEEVVKTLIEAIVLVVLMMYLFLQNLRATLIPAIAVPVVLGHLRHAGHVRLFDQHADHVRPGAGHRPAGGRCHRGGGERRAGDERGKLCPREATRKSMQEITGALVGIAMVLSAVFMPMAFFGGSTGVIYRQFSITIVSAMALSVMVALTLTPAVRHAAQAACGGHVQQGRFFTWFNRTFDRSATRYQGGVGGLLKRQRGLLMYALIAVAMAVLFMRLPTSFLPEEDQGVLMARSSCPRAPPPSRPRPS